MSESLTLFRPKQPLPDKPGWYYARWKTGRGISPTLVRESDCLFVVQMGLPVELHNFEWFGPVPPVKEARLPKEKTND